MLKINKQVCFIIKKIKKLKNSFQNFLKRELHQKYPLKITAKN